LQTWQSLPSKTSRQQAEIIRQRSRAEPEWFARRVLRHDPWDVPNAVMRAVNRPRSLVAVKACHASAKTFTAAEIVLWWVFAQNGIAITTAPTWSQVRMLLWSEIRKAHSGAKSILGGNPNQTSIEIAPDIYAMGLSTNEGVRFQGFHGKVLIVIDEAPGVREDIFEAIDGIRAGGDVRVLMLGNPIIASGRFYEAFTAERSLWTTFTINAFDTPNLEGISLDDLRAIPIGADDPRLFVSPRPYLVTRQWVHEKLHTWGERSPLWQSKVLGGFPDQAEDALLSLAWLEAAHDGPEQIDDLLPCRAGVDVAGPGEDETVLVIRQGSNIVRMRHWHDPDPRGELLAELRRWKIEQVNVDSVGMGHYLARHIEDAGYTVNDVNVGVSARDSERFANLKAELYWGLRERFESSDVHGLTDDLAVSQLAGIRYDHNARGQIVIESKADARKRGVKSPDRAEAVMLAFAQSPVGWDSPAFADIYARLQEAGVA
jgi:hypothetical protein